MKKRPKQQHGDLPAVENALVFESKPLVVTWQTKSENIYFEGEKSNALEEQVKAHIESKLESGNAELMSDSKQQQQSVDDSSLSSRGEPDTSACVQ